MQPPCDATRSGPLFRPTRLVNRAARLLARIGDARLRPLGLAVGQLPVLVTLHDRGASSQKELARIARIEQPSMAQALARMERDGLIRRSPNPRDARSSLVSLTPDAVARLPDARRILEQGSSEALAGFDDGEIETFSCLLQRLIDNLEAIVDGAARPDETKRSPP